jgi:hypothetical protein
MITFSQWLKLREDFHQGTGGAGVTLPLKSKRKRSSQTPIPTFNLQAGQGVQGTRRDDGNG